MHNIYVYDFDETIYDGDVTRDFYKYCIKNQPKILKHLLAQILAFIKYILGFIKWTEFKGEILGYFKYIDNIDLTIENFWNEHKHKIKNWYLEKDHSNDVIISASPECLLEKICYNELKIKLLIGTLADKNTGKIFKQNCYGNQKVIRLNEVIKNYNILEFYSDSLSDFPLAVLAKKSFIVKKDNLIEWNKYKLTKFEKTKSLFFSRDFILFVIIGVINTFNGVIFSLIFNYWVTNSLIAFLCGYILSNFVAYLLNSVIIFKDNVNLLRYVKFFISYIPNFFIQIVIVFLMCNILKLHNVIAYLTASIIGVPVTYLCVKLFAFKPAKKQDINPYIYKEL